MIEENRSGAISATGGAELELTGSTVSGTTGAAAISATGSTVTITTSTIADNEPELTGGSNSGAGIAITNPLGSDATASSSAPDTTWTTTARAG